MLENGYRYNDFESVLSELRMENDIAYNKSEDTYTLYKEVGIKIQTLGNRVSCYGCLFRLNRRDIEDRNIASNIQDITEEDIICAIRPLEETYDGMSWPHWFKCPLNEAIEKEPRTDG